ncbi:uncharacterized protein LOC132902979 [Amyelois transitella]|uniref:uncharacterized protein LOC132902979 n=1 Tax=Amyelois transitella TaxID=680683 RepID=UPI0029907609|nr:uncharacterized protein LOC132902979 [Amyelois transitella]
MTIERQWYLYNKIREFVEEESKDILCPKPIVLDDISTPSQCSVVEGTTTSTSNTSSNQIAKRVRKTPTCSYCKEVGHRNQSAEKQRRYRERCKNNPEKVAEAKRKDLERYHAKKRLVKDLWRSANSRRKDKARALRIVMHTPESTPPRLDSRASIDQVISRDYRRSSTPQLSTSRENTPHSTTSSVVRGRKQVKRNRSKLFRDNTKLKEQLQAVNKKCSYKTFTRYRPFYVVLPTVAARETCLCRIHTNIQYLAVSVTFLSQ